MNPRSRRAKTALLSAHEKLLSWRAVADDLGVNVRHVYYFATRGIEPVNPEVRHKLGLDTLTTAAVVIVGPGAVPPGAQVISAQRCACGQWYVSNHPRRGRCFICSPARISRKQESDK